MLKIGGKVQPLLLLPLLLLCNINAFEAKRTDADIVEDAEIIEAAQPTSSRTSNSDSQKTRNARQLFYEPNLIFVSSVGVSAVAEGGKCSTTLGLPGNCLRIEQCSAYYRVAPEQYQRRQQQQQQSFYTGVQQWWLPPTPPQPPTVNGIMPFGSNELCTFYDQLGRVNNGICCTFSSFGGSGGGNGGNEFDFGAWPLPAPPTAVTPPTPPAEGEVELIEPVVDNSGVQRPVIGQNDETTDEKEAVDDVPDNADVAPDFNVDDNNVVYDPISDDEDFASTMNTTTPPTTLTATTYHDVRYPWPQNPFVGQFGGVALPQWPPPLPTHPPSAASWPPPIPTHPPNHHYPTHPSATRPTTKPQATTKRPSTAVTTTRRSVTTTKPTTTTRRPSYPSYPGYPPGFPTYPTYPTYRPPVTSAPPTTTTTRRSTTGTGSGSGSSANGLPLQCGVRNPTSPDQERIVGGTNASPYEFPWIAVLFKAGKQFCGGSLITRNHVLTAAHCVARMTSWDVAALTVHLGDYNIRTDFEVKHVERRVKRLVRHKGFDFSHLHNDIAILTLNEPVKFTYEIQPICLPTSSTQQSRSYSGHLATVAGWGSLRESGPQPAVLQKVDIPIWSNLDCARKYGRAAPGGIIESMVCAGTLSKDSCSGDSGGPLIVRDDGGRYTQVGIVSWGIGCGKGQYPGVYTRVTTLLSWIYKNIKM